MRIIVHLSDDEALQMIEDRDENIKEAYKEIIRKIENVCAKYRIQYDDIEVVPS